MTLDEKRIKIAEACGWRIVTTIKYSWVVITPQNMEYAWSSQAGEMNDKQASYYLPDYFGDLNAMHEAEKVFSNDEIIWFNYKRKILYLIGPEQHQIHAEAKHRAEAFGLTLNLW